MPYSTTTAYDWNITVNRPPPRLTLTSPPNPHPMWRPAVGPRGLSETNTAQQFLIPGITKYAVSLFLVEGTSLAHFSYPAHEVWSKHKFLVPGTRHESRAARSLPHRRAATPHSNYKTATKAKTLSPSHPRPALRRPRAALHHAKSTVTSRIRPGRLSERCP